jgi:hypothetical protein
MKKNLNLFRILSSDMSKFGRRLLYGEAIGVEVSALQFTTKASSSETANNHFKIHIHQPAKSKWYDISCIQS